MRKWLPAVLIVTAFIVSALLLPRLPELVEPKLDALLPFSTTTAEPASRWWLAFALPAAALCVWLLFVALTTRRGFALQRRMLGRWAPAHTVEPEAIERFRSTYDLVITLVIAFLLVFHLAVLGLAAGGPSWIARALALLVGLGLAVMGNVLPRTRPNPIMGLRTSRTLHDPLLWARLHRLFGGLLVAAGVVVMLLAWFAVRYALLACVVGILASCLIVLIVLIRTPHARARTGAAALLLFLLGFMG